MMNPVSGNVLKVLLVAALLYLIIANIIWIAIDTTPPFWDMAYHQMGALQILAAFEQHGFTAIAHLPGLTGYYPPVYHAIVAGFYWLFGAGPDIGRLANLPATVLLIFSTYGIGRRLLQPSGAALAAVLVSFYPLMVWVSREAVIDYWLASLVAFGIWLLLKTENFSRRRPS